MCVIAKPTKVQNRSCYNIEGKKEFIQNGTTLTRTEEKERKEKKERMKPMVIHTETRAPVEESIETPLNRRGGGSRSGPL